MDPVLSTNWLVLKSALSKKASWYSCDRLSGRTPSLSTLKCSVLTPWVLASAPSLLVGISSARRKAVCALKMESSVMRVSTGSVSRSMSNWGVCQSGVWGGGSWKKAYQRPGGDGQDAQCLAEDETWFLSILALEVSETPITHLVQ